MTSEMEFSAEQREKAMHGLLADAVPEPVSTATLEQRVEALERELKALRAETRNAVLMNTTYGGAR